MGNNTYRKLEHDETSGSPLFEPSNLDWEAYLGLGIKRYYPKGVVLFHSNTYLDSIYYLKLGVVKQSLISPGGTEKVVGLIKAGNIFGEAIFFHGYPAQCDNITAEDSLVYSFSRDAIEEMIGLNPEIMIHFVRSMSLKIRMLTTQIDMLYSLGARSKVCKLLRLLAQQSPQRSIRMTHQEIADIAGVHRVTVSNTIIELRRQGIIGYDGGQLEVKELESLASMAAGLPISAEEARG